MEEDRHLTQKEYIEVEAESNRNNLAIFSFTFTKRGKIKKVIEYLDVKTGEIIPSDKAGIKVIKPDAMLERLNRLDALKDSVKDFALFLLSFRNKACGFLVPIEVIVKWYSIYSSKQVQHTRRLIQSLIQAKILSNEYELESIFMINNPHREWKDAKGDLCRAQVIFEIKMLKIGRNNQLDETSTW